MTELCCYAYIYASVSRCSTPIFLDTSMSTLLTTASAEYVCTMKQAVSADHRRIHTTSDTMSDTKTHSLQLPFDIVTMIIKKRLDDSFHALPLRSIRATGVRHYQDELTEIGRAHV